MDVRSMLRTRKKVKKFNLQEENESRKVWKYVTEALEREDSAAAATAKHEVFKKKLYVFILIDLSLLD